MSLENIDPTLLLVAGLALAVFVLMRKFRSAASQPEKSAEKVELGNKRLGAAGREEALGDAPKEVLRWQVEMHQTARDLKAEIDTKLVAVQVVTRLASEERQRLEAVIERARRSGLTPAADLLDTLDRLPSDPESVQDLPTDIPLASLPADDQQSAANCQLSTSGHSAASIAQRLALPVGDVELALSLQGPAGRSRRLG